MASATSPLSPLPIANVQPVQLPIRLSSVDPFVLTALLGESVPRLIASTSKPRLEYLITNAHGRPTSRIFNSAPFLSCQLSHIFLDVNSRTSILGIDLDAPVFLKLTFAWYGSTITALAIDINPNCIGIPKRSIFCDMSNVAYFASHWCSNRKFGLLVNSQ